MTAWKDRRHRLEIRVFGSFEEPNRSMLDALVAHLRDHEFTDTSTVEVPVDKKDDESAERVYDECREAASTCDVAIFVMFSEGAEANQSIQHEIDARVKHLEERTGTPCSPDNTIVLVQEGVPIRTMLRGLLAKADLTTPDEWEGEEELLDRGLGAVLRLI